MLRYLTGCPELSQIFTAEFIPPTVSLFQQSILIPPGALAPNFWLLFFSHTAHRYFSKSRSPPFEKSQSEPVLTTSLAPSRPDISLHPPGKFQLAFLLSPRPLTARRSLQNRNHFLSLFLLKTLNSFPRHLCTHCSLCLELPLKAGPKLSLPSDPPAEVLPSQRGLL